MGTNHNLSEAEHGVLNTARGLLGPNLSDFLLSRLGESQVTHRRSFAASGAGAQGEEVYYRFEMIGDSREGLPIERDSLVMAALIGLLREWQPMDDKVGFAVDDILKILQWPQGKESNLMVTRAVERYASTTYCLIDQPLPGKASGSQFTRLVIGYVIISKPPPVKRRTPPIIIKVQFRPYLINAFIIYGRKHFLGVEFQILREFQEISQKEI